MSVGQYLVVPLSGQLMYVSGSETIPLYIILPVVVGGLAVVVLLSLFIICCVVCYHNKKSKKSDQQWINMLSQQKDMSNSNVINILFCITYKVVYYE